MRLLIYILHLQCFVICLFNEFANGQETESHANKALLIVKENAVILDSISQLLVVFNETPESNSAVLIAMEKKDKEWMVLFKPMPAGIGRKGFASPGKKREGDEKSPTGFFRLGQLFCYEKNVDTKMPFTQTTPEDKWIDDPNSPDYNKYIRGATQALTYEKLRLNGNDYRYCMVIEYNTHPVVKGMGSAIFLHLSEKETINSSSGCVVLTQKDMEQLIKWMNPVLKPSILMGNERVLLDGLKRSKH